MPRLTGQGRHLTIVPWRGERSAIMFVGLLPAAVYFWYGAHGQLGADPVNVFERWLGLWAVRFLLLGLLVTPLRVMMGCNLLRYRRTFGLLAFWYACMHVATYVVLDQRGDMGVLLRDITHRPFLMLGFAAFLLLLPLAMTSNDWSIRRLGRWWGRLHRLVYIIAVLAAVHFLMAFKTYNMTSISYAGALVLLVLWRGWHMWRRHTAMRMA
ncbi:MULTISPECIES: protein-methionine-sulfoxide reductase heme-binding subunit MsrQ [Komagataeibacter]|uniref:Protein-methionine-sulfoxide reductase heme-binding subunit MsrQ n=2 Tax=Komagataeibacter TaxID=1434011 RepID=A0A0D6Q813_KOMXY|nr:MULTISPECIES: protein-methionine-sulfoxide reductase heme-binding subunit MsrQ [Komagataeibacter]MBL7234883.1 protein-methionine-sulfoxide reductase heme-binding subunit MsrQ [Komagataeibacter oboediens]MBT0676867.1 protein-methionine-sulfoxide reductase heme-binding subunit MsrQ [Komagataeibacter oboediens]MBT0680185.1 protein-methionine-sulfoxide reductase heme-binding subunit MsrQ [Komagataeibacter oboediens]MBV0888209.1 protein-methionine-sulfoxide reductase heme-binding subunit MsrQ [Ko